MLVSEQIAAGESVTAEDIPRFAVDLGDAVAALRRGMRRAARAAVAGEPLPASDAELLAHIGRSRGVTVSDAARRLRLAPNTVSTLVRRLTDAGLVERRTDAADRRVARLHLTPAGSARFRRVRRRRSESLGRAIGLLDDGDRRALEAALPALRRLSDLLDEVEDAG